MPFLLSAYLGLIQISTNGAVRSEGLNQHYLSTHSCVGVTRPTVVLSLVSLIHNLRIAAIVAQRLDDDAAVSAAAIDTLVQMGPVALPFVLWRLRSSDSQVRLHALEVLYRLGSEGRLAVSSLMDMLKHEGPRGRREIILILGRSGDKDCIPLLIRVLTADKDVQVRIAACYALSEFGMNASSSTDALFDILTESTHHGVREREQHQLKNAAASALAHVGCDVIDRVRCMLRSKDVKSYEVGLWVSEHLAEKGVPLVPEILCHAESLDQNVASVAISELGRMGSGLRGYLKQLVAHVGKLSGCTKMQLAGIILGVDASERVAWNVLVDGVGSTDSEVRLLALGELTRRARQAKELVDIVKKLINDPDEQVRYQSVQFMASLCCESRVATLVVGRAAADSSAEIRLLALRGLSESPYIDIVLGPLLRLVGDSDSTIRSKALGEVGKVMRLRKQRHGRAGTG